MTKTNNLLLIAAVLCLTACEKPLVGATDDADDNTEEGFQLVFNSHYSMTPFGSGDVRASVSDAATRLDIAVYDSSGTRIRKEAQELGDAGFGTFKVSLPKGNYSVAMIAHSGSNAATTTQRDKITFANNKLTDTFLYYADIAVNADHTYDVTLNRVVAMVRFIVEDATPSNVAQMKFYYTGGSSTLDATTRLGCVNSKQTELRDVDSANQSGGATYEVYTFPHSTGDNETLKLTVTAQDASGSTLYENVYASVPVKTNYITQYKGVFFNGSTTGSNAQGYNLSVANTWTSTNSYSY